MILQIEVNFIDKTVPNDEGFTLNLSLKMKYDEFSKLVGEHLNYDPKQIQFFRSSSQNYDFKSSTLVPIKYQPDFQLGDALLITKQQLLQQQQNQSQNQPRKLFYQKLKMTIVELEERRQFKCLWVSSNLKVERELTFMPLKKSTVKEILNECRKELLKENLITQEDYDNENGYRLRLVEIAGCKISRIFKEDVAFDTLESSQMSANKIYRVEQIQPDELELVNSLGGAGQQQQQNHQTGDDYLLPVAHFCKEVYATFGAPFLIRIKLGEPFVDIKQRIQRRLDVNEKEFATVIFFNQNFSLVSINFKSFLTFFLSIDSHS